MGYKVAVVGATGNVGRELLDIMAERNFPVSEVVALASSRSVGRQVAFGDDDITVQDLATFDFKGTDIVLSSPGASVSAEYSPKAAAAGAVIVDNTSHWRMDPDVPLIVPRSEPGRDCRLQQERHHRQPELFDHSDGGRHEAIARSGND